MTDYIYSPQYQAFLRLPTQVTAETTNGLVIAEEPTRKDQPEDYTMEDERSGNNIAALVDQLMGIHEAVDMGSSECSKKDRRSGMKTLMAEYYRAAAMVMYNCNYMVYGLAMMRAGALGWVAKEPTINGFLEIGNLRMRTVKSDSLTLSAVENTALLVCFNLIVPALISIVDVWESYVKNVAMCMYYSYPGENKNARSYGSAMRTWTIQGRKKDTRHLRGNAILKYVASMDQAYPGMYESRYGLTKRPTWASMANEIEKVVDRIRGCRFFLATTAKSTFRFNAYAPVNGSPHLERLNHTFATQICNLRSWHAEGYSTSLIEGDVFKLLLQHGAGHEATLGLLKSRSVQPGEKANVCSAVEKLNSTERLARKMLDKQKRELSEAFTKIRDEMIMKEKASRNTRS